MKTTHRSESIDVVYLAKFPEGFYAEYQPNYPWSFTDDPLKAKQYKNPTYKNIRQILRGAGASEKGTAVPFSIRIVMEEVK